MELVQQLGTKWSKIVKMLPGRTDNAVKNRWNSTMRKSLRRQLKEFGGGSALFQLDKLPARKRGSATSAEVATAAAAATVTAAAAASARSGGRSPKSRSPIGKRPTCNKLRSPANGATSSAPLVAQHQAERQQQLAVLGDHTVESTTEKVHSSQHSPQHRPMCASRPEVGCAGLRFDA